MKKIVYLVSIVCLMFYSCTKDDEKTLTLSENSVTFTSDGGEQQILVTANTNWEARSEADWIDLVTFGRTGNGTIVIKAQPNYPIARTKSKTGNNAENYYSTVERSVKIFVTTLLDGINEEIIISQKGYTDTPFQVYHGNCPFKGNIDLVGIPRVSMASFDSPDGFPSPTFGIPEYPWKIIGEVKDGIMAIGFPEDKYELTPQYKTFTEGLIMSQVFIEQNSNPFLTIRLLVTTQVPSSASTQKKITSKTNRKQKSISLQI